MKKFKILITAYDCRPMLGGISTFVDEVCGVFATEPETEIRLLARKIEGQTTAESLYDQSRTFQVRRVSLSNRSELATFALRAAIKQEVKAFEPDAILNFLWLPEAVATYLSAGTVPYYILAHGVEVLEGSGNFRKKIRALFAPVKKAVFKNAAHVLVNSDYTRSLVQKNCGVALHKIIPIYAGVSCEKFTPGPKPEALVQKYGLSGKKVLLTITRLVDYKGTDFTLQSLGEILKAHPDLVYLIGGVGEDELRLRKMVRELRLEKSVIFIGKIPESELEAHYRLCDAFIMLSREDYVTPNVEGFGLVFLEASACEKPVIGGKSGGVVDAVQDGVSGILVNPTDPSAIARGVINLFNDPSLMKTLGVQGRVRARNQFSWKSVSDRILTHIKAV